MMVKLRFDGVLFKSFDDGAQALSGGGPEELHHDTDLLKVGDQGGNLASNLLSEDG